ncbi:hypothetical protein [Roseibacillus ishigakijimensis]|uniref:Uncharacterized protein n=1 Tax=Roseibacillus ishigakijimensis TaxID=454146 RepID=A0A934RUN9_9BACT|nr:hypothetical protein [Roseibacillus ishigakijimensis]MBK1835738.1 hypothetical protein [Roseibacillus ishigakijimensis]
MYLLTFEAVPTSQHEDFSEVEGAWINAWIPSAHAVDIRTAEGLARDHIESSHWFIKYLDQASELDEDEFEPLDDDEEYFRTALAGEQAFVFHTYPLERNQQTE